MADRRRAIRSSTRRRDRSPRAGDPVRRRLAEALARERATRAVLQVVAASRGSAVPVFEAILDHARRLCASPVGLLFLYDGEAFRLVADRGAAAAFTDPRRQAFRPGPHTGLARAVAERRPVQIRDVTADRAYAERDPSRLETVRLLGVRTGLWVPLLRDGVPVGTFVVWRQKVRPFTRDQVDLLATFAAQAVVALENARLFQELEARNRDLTEALEQQTATAGILRIISSSPTDLQPVLDAVAESAARLCEALDASILLRQGDALRVQAHFGPIPVSESVQVARGSVSGRSVIERATVHVHDLAEMAEEFPVGRYYALRDGVRTILATPLLREGVALGAIMIRRSEVRPFSTKQVGLLQTFADQAVIAIENVRLFQELQARNRELTEALEQQTATSEVLKVISRSTFDLRPVLETLVENASRLCGAEKGFIFRREGEVYRLAVDYGASPEFVAFIEANPIPPGRATLVGRTALEGRTVHIPDAASDPEYGWAESQRLGGFRTMLGVPMLRAGVPIGVIALWREEVRPFTAKQIELVTTFADQAVIAIENVRLFQELQTRNRELTEALEQQTATSEVLRVISSSPTDLQPVFDIIAESAVRLCGAEVSQVTRFDGEWLHLGAFYGSSPTATEDLRRTFPRRPSGAGASERAIRDRAVVHIPDILVDEEYRLQGVAIAAGYRAILGVPMLREDRAVGAIIIGRAEPGAFSARQIALLRTFADQAVIAIENVRLFGELRARTAELARSVEELRALGEVGHAVSSTLDLATVLTTIVTRAVELARASGGVIYEYDEATQEFRLRASHRMEEELVEALRASPIRLGEGTTGQAAAVRAPVQVANILDDTRPGAARIRAVLARLGYRSVLSVPLLLEQRILGTLTVWRQETGQFVPEVVNLLQTFAAQSVLAIQNARLFRELEDKSRQLEVASRHKSQFLANMSHELRTPLNAILGYTELIQDRIYGEVPPKISEVMERIDRSGRHLLGLINDVLDLSKIEAGQLVLALNDYSLKEVVQTVVSAVEGLAAEKKLALKVTVAPDLPRGRGDERRLAQVLLNLVGNALKFTEAGEVRVDARAAGDRFVVAVADTGPGIAPADQARIFDEFQQADTSATRKKGGTGLGLSIARRIVELHGGAIAVESAAGQGATFTVTLPVRVDRQAAPA